MKTIKEIYEAVLIEQNKLQAPALKLYEFNYFLNKAIQQVVNKKYNLYETNQLITDDLMGLKESKTYTTLEDSDGKPIYEAHFDSELVDLKEKHLLSEYSIKVPNDYFHILNCICKFKGLCYSPTPASKITADSWGTIINNWYNKPSIYKPYYKIEGNKIIIESGKNPLEELYIEYLKVPTLYELSKTLLNSIDDISTTIEEFPDYMIREIINELMYLVLERSSDPRLVNNALITLTIANPTQLVLSN